MSTDRDKKHSCCCSGSAKPVPQETQQSVTQATTPNVDAKESIIISPEKPVIPQQPKSKSCCGEV